MSRAYDAIVIGGGQAGPFLAARLAGAGQRTALIERRHMGGTCVNDGCQPTKTMVASARVAYLARRAADFGVSTGPVDVDMAAVKARKDKIVLASREGLDSWMEGTENLSVLRGSAAFTGPGSVEVNGIEIEGARIFLNTGARAVVPGWAGGVPISPTPRSSSSTRCRGTSSSSAVPMSGSSSRRCSGASGPR